LECILALAPFATDCVEFTFCIWTSCAPHCIAASALQWEGIAWISFRLLSI
jgi:hypothetical protein